MFTTGLKSSVLQVLFERYFKWRLRELVHPAYPILLEYPITPKVRWGQGKPPHPELAAILAKHVTNYEQTLHLIESLLVRLKNISLTEQEALTGEPFWNNTYFSALDAMALYAFLSLHRPNLYVEVGSGNSTKFARRAVRDFNLETSIISIDPQPRAEIDALCDRVFRTELENLDLGFFDVLKPGDFLFIDNSHRAFQNSDATVFFMDVLPRLKPGTIVHIHDIFLPFDYPQAWLDRYYSEQYLLGASLLAGTEKFEVLLAAAYVSEHPVLGQLLQTRLAVPEFEQAFKDYRKVAGGYYGTSFWFRVKHSGQ